MADIPEKDGCLVIDAFLFFIVASIVFVAAGIAFIILFIECVKQTKLEDGRYFGLNCDRCTGKFNRHGNRLLRCSIKPKILDWCKRKGVCK